MVHTFAAIDVGSFELTMKIFEYGGKKPMKEIDCIATGLSLGADTYATGKISNEKVDELCKVLNHFSQIMKSYKVEEYRAYGTSAIRETENSDILLDLIETRTGIHIETLSNSEQRFLDYKSIAGAGDVFYNAIAGSAAILDIGGGSIQISLFDEDSLVSTQNLKLGVLRIRERVESLGADPYRMRLLEEELIDAQLLTYKKLFITGSVKNLIVMDDYISSCIVMKSTGGKGCLSRAEFEKLLESVSTRGTFETAKAFGVPEEKVPLLRISGLLVKSLAKILKSEMIYAPGVTLSDGIAYEFAEEKKIIKREHDFEKDIIACALNISRRYNGSRSRAETLRQICSTIFDSVKKAGGLTKRDKLYLDIATILHDCGKYIAMTEIGERSYDIIMATEIIGLNHREREIVANIVRFNHSDFVYPGTYGATAGLLDKNSYITIAKLTAILRVANSLDRSHKQKMKEIKATVDGRELLLKVDTPQTFLLEEAFFPEAADFFEEIYSIKPVIVRSRDNV